MMDIFNLPQRPHVPLADRKSKKFSEAEGIPVGYDWVIETTEQFIEEMDKNISYVREIISNQAIVNQDKHPDITSAISEGWENPALIPYSLYENLIDSQLASHKFIRELVLDVSRSIVGDNSIDLLDYFKCLRTEAECFLGFVRRYPDMQVAQVEPCIYYASRLWACYNRMSLLKYNNSTSTLEIAISDTSTILDQQKKIHSLIIKTNKIISADKALLANITIESSEKYFSEKLPSQMTQSGFTIDAKEMFKKRIDAIEEISNDVQDSISAVNSMRAYHSQLGESPDGVAPEDVTAGFTVQNDPVGIADANNSSQVLRNNVEVQSGYFPSMVFTATEQLSAYEIVDLLNNLPATHTYIRAGIISVAAEWEFVNELVQQINNQPDNSTLISGGMISLKGTSLDSWGDSVDISLADLYSAAYATASGMIDMMNNYTEGGGLSVLLPGVIGLRGDVSGGIRDAIIDKLNETTTSSGNSTLIGPGVVLINGSNTLNDKWPVWESDITDAISSAGNANDLAATALQNAADAQETADSQIVGFFQDSIPTSGMSFGDIWIDTDHVPSGVSSVFRYQNPTGGSSGVLSWQLASGNAIGLTYLEMQTLPNDKIKTFFGPSGQIAENIGDLWIDSSNGNKMYRWSGTEWVAIQDIAIQDALDNALAAIEVSDGQITGFYQNSEPASGVSSYGDIWIDLDKISPLDSTSIYRYQNATGGSSGILSWRSASGNAIGAAYLYAYDAQTIADGKINTFYGVSATGAAVGDLWIDTGDGNRLHRWSGSSWIDMQDAGISSASIAASGALSAANNAQGSADQALGFLDNMASDNILSPVEKPSIIMNRDILLAEQAGVSGQASAYGVSATSYNTAISDLVSYLASIPTGTVVPWYTTSGDTAIVGTTFRSKFSDVYTTRQTLLNNIYAAAKILADNAQGDANQALQDAAGAQETADGQIVGYFQDNEPLSGMTFGDIWIDTDHSPSGVTSIFRYQNPTGGSNSVLNWYVASGSAIGNIYFDAYNAQETANTKIYTFYQDDPPTSLAIGDLWVDTNDNNKLYRALSVGAYAITAGGWVLVRDTTMDSVINSNASGTALVNYWNLTNSTLVDGSAIGAGTISLDKVVVGLSPVYTNASQISYAQGASGDIVLDSINSIQEIRLGGPSFWPATSTYYKFKILTRSSSGGTWNWFRGGEATWSTATRQVANDSAGNPTQPASIIPFLGSQAQEIRFVFDKFYDSGNSAVSASFIVPSGSFIVYGGTGLWDGSGIYADSITIGSFESGVQTTINSVGDVITNFDNRNDRVATTPFTPSVAPSAITHSINTDGSCDLYFSWTS